MTQEKFGFGESFREVMLRGRSPLEYIQEEVDMLKRIHQAEAATWTNDDLAMALTSRMRLGVINEQEMEESLPYLGLTLEEADSLLGESMPRAREYFTIQERISADFYDSVRSLTSDSSGFLTPQERLVPTNRYDYIRELTKNLTYEMPSQPIERPKNPQDKQ